MGNNYTTPILIAAAVGGVALHLFRLQSSAKDIRYSITDFKMQGLGGTVTLDIVNPTVARYTLKSLVADVTIDKNRVGMINYSGNITIDKFKTTRVTMPVTIDPVGAAGTLLNLIKQGIAIFRKPGSKPSAMATINGTMWVSGFQIPIKDTIAIL